jgi:hypothetical protein
MTLVKKLQQLVAIGLRRRVRCLDTFSLQSDPRSTAEPITSPWVVQGANVTRGLFAIRLILPLLGQM